jgi:hypothetical protein
MSVYLLNNVHVGNNLFLFNAFGAFFYSNSTYVCTKPRKHTYAHKNPDILIQFVSFKEKINLKLKRFFNIILPTPCYGLLGCLLPNASKKKWSGR